MLTGVCLHILLSHLPSQNNLGLEGSTPKAKTNRRLGCVVTSAISDLSIRHHFGSKLRNFYINSRFELGRYVVFERGGGNFVPVVTFP